MPRKPPRRLLDTFARAAKPAKREKKRRLTKPTKQTLATAKTGATRLSRAIVRTTEETKRQTKPARIAAALARRNLDDAVATIPLDAGAAELRAAHAQVYRDVFEAAAEINARVVGSVYSVLDPRPLQFMERAGAKFVTEITRTQRADLRAVLVEMLNAGQSVQEAAKHLREHIGLTSRLSTAVENYRADLIAQELPAARIARMVERKAARLLRYRSVMIARTEAQYAAHAGQHEAWTQAREQGLIDETAEQEWLTTSTPCPQICDPANGQRRPLGEQFEMGDGSLVDGPPAHPNCLCSLVLHANVVSKSEAA